MAFPHDGKKIPKGQSGNPKGRPKLPDLKEVLAEVLGESKDNLLALTQMMKAQRAKAIRGDTKAAEFLTKYAYGLPKQDITMTVPEVHVVLPKK